MTRRTTRRRLIALARLRQQIHLGRGDVAALRTHLHLHGRTGQEPRFAVELGRLLLNADQCDQFEGIYTEARSRARWSAYAQRMGLVRS